MRSTKPRKIRLTEKYMRVIESFAELIDPEGYQLTWTVIGGDPFGALRKMVAKIHAKYLNEDDAQDLILDEYSDFVIEAKAQQPPPDAAEARSALVKKLKERIESYPRQYVLRLNLPSFPAYKNHTVELASDVRLVLSRPVAKRRGPISKAVLGEGDESPGLGTWLEVDAVGYATRSPESPAAADAIAVAKQCMFILEATSMLQRTYFASRPASATLDQKGGKLSVELPLPRLLAHHWARLIPDEHKLTVLDPNHGRNLFESIRPAKDGEERARALANAMRGLTRYLESRHHPDFERIAAAIQWHQDSTYSENQTFAFLAVCIGLEAILGERGHLNEMSNRLADRFAFRLGTNRSHREALGKTYIAILNLRGDLVHAKAARLKSAEDRKLLNQARVMLHNLIWHELGIVYKEVEKEQKEKSKA